MRGDLIETYGILRGFDRVDAERLFLLVGESRTRGRGSPIGDRDEEEFLLSEGGECVEFVTAEAASFSMFKAETDSFLISEGIEGYGGKVGVEDYHISPKMCGLG